MNARIVSIISLETCLKIAVRKSVKKRYLSFR